MPALNFTGGASGLGAACVRMIVENGLKYGQMTKDELFVSYNAAKAGVTITNKSETEDLVMLKHFGPGNSEAAKLIPAKQ